MAAPFIFIGTHKAKPGRLEEFKAWFADFCDIVVEPNEPRLLSFNAYADPDASEVTVVQVHPDAESMVHHMSVIAEHVAQAYMQFPRAGESLADLRDSSSRCHGADSADGWPGRTRHEPRAVRRLHPTRKLHDRRQPLNTGEEAASPLPRVRQ